MDASFLFISTTHYGSVIFNVLLYSVIYTNMYKHATSSTEFHNNGPFYIIIRARVRPTDLWIIFAEFIKNI